MKAVRFQRFGGPEVLAYEEDIPVPTADKGEVLIKVAGAGVNFADILRRAGDYPGEPPPATLGLEAAGVVQEVGPDVSVVKAGDSVIARWASGAQAEYVTTRASVLFPCPPGIDLVQAGGMPIIFLTAYHVLKTRAAMKSGETVLVHASASGVGTACIQLAKHWGARVIATASTEKKLELATSLGADICINYTSQDFEKNVMEVTEGRGADVILDCVGGDVSRKSLRALAPYGRLVIYGNASRSTETSLPITDIFPANRAVLGFSMGRSPVGTLHHREPMMEMLPLIESGKLRLAVDRIMPMSRVADVHVHLANRGTMGKVILVPD